MAVYWHPFLVQFLRDDYGDRLEVLDEVPLGRMPPRLDIAIIRRDPRLELPFPFCHLGPITVVEFKGPDKAAGQAELVKLEGYSLLYQCRRHYWERSELTLWLAASRFSKQVLRPGGACLQEAKEVGTGVIGGIMDGFPTFLLDLDVLDLNEATLPLKMVSRGPHEQELVEFLVDQPDQFAHYIRQLPLLHAATLEEVLKMRKMTPEQIGLDMADVVRLFGEDQVLRALGPERAIEALGPERFVRTFGKARLRALLDQMEDEPDGNGGTET